jgi:hypothetical protein
MNIRFVLIDRVFGTALGQKFSILLLKTLIAQWARAGKLPSKQLQRLIRHRWLRPQLRPVQDLLINEQQRRTRIAESVKRAEETLAANRQMQELEKRMMQEWSRDPSLRPEGSGRSSDSQMPCPAQNCLRETLPPPSRQQ